MATNRRGNFRIYYNIHVYINRERMISLLFHFSIFYQQYNYPIERNIEEPKDTNQVIQSSTEKSNIVTFLCVCVYTLHASYYAWIIVFRLFFPLFSILYFSFSLCHSFFNHTPRYTMKRRAIDLPIDFAVGELFQVLRV